MDELEAVTMPVLLVHGEHDSIVPWAGGHGPRPPTQRQLGPICRLPALPFFEDPKRYLHTINTFIQNTAIQRYPACCDRSSA
jgi:pimeloyl-ACP methyl ester carboxylesterase